MDEQTFFNSNLFYAAETGQLDLAREFLDKGADPDYIELGLTTLGTAVFQDYTDVARLLLERGANPNLKSDAGLTPLMQSQSGEIVKLLAEYGADPKVCDDDGHSAVDYFAMGNCHGAIQAWREIGWPIKTKKRLLDRLLTKEKFDMITRLTGFQFRAEGTLAKMAEFKARYI